MQLDDFRHWTAWSPWEDLDPQRQRDYSGAERGLGAAYQWAGNGMDKMVGANFERGLANLKARCEA